jgi:LmbE family N-acetylglucosaminyl deacetylase
MHLFLSPHFDDAVMSCGGKIHQLAISDQVVTVRTVMGQNPKQFPDTPIVRELHDRWGSGNDSVAIRIQEDEAAVKSLGATPHRMTVWPDCIYRCSKDGTPLYPSQESVFGNVHVDDMAATLIPTIVLSPRDDTKVIYAPLAVGHHVDHLIVRDWALELQRQNPSLTFLFYEDYPYSENSGDVDLALFFFKENGFTLERDTVILSDASVEAKIRAIGCYRTQMSSFWSGAEAMRQAILQHLLRAGAGKPAERYWRVLPQ